MQPMVDWSLVGTSAWLNIWPDKRTDTSGHALPHKPTPAKRPDITPGGTSKNPVLKTIESLLTKPLLDTGKKVIKSAFASFL